MRHHYSVSSQGLPTAGGAGQSGTADSKLFHTFEEAQDHFTGLVDQAKEGGGEVTGESYWRRDVKPASGGAVHVALDDVGLLACGPACGAAA